MKKYELKSNVRVNQIFEDLEKYLEFCREYGYVFDESTLYDQRNLVYRQFNKFLQGREAKNNWLEDMK